MLVDEWHHREGADEWHHTGSNPLVERLHRVVVGDCRSIITVTGHPQASHVLWQSGHGPTVVLHGCW